MNGDTIFAPATGAGPAGIAILRVSGPRAGAVLAALAGGPGEPGRARVRRLRHPVTGETLDRALVLWFPGPASYTGEDMAELQVHGGPAVVAGVGAALAGIEGVRPAEAGEFSRRAFANGKLDLTAVEGLADVVAAETEAQRRQAVRQMEGALGRLYEGWRRRLVRALARAEAAIEFPDESLPDGLGEGVRAEVAAIGEEIAAHLDDGGRGERLRTGVVVAIVGPPNVGKSSLLNRLAGSEAAIVSARPGTTRDVLEVRLDVGGVPVTVCDTAGLRASGDEIEAEGVRRARARAAAADLRLGVVSAEDWPTVDGETRAAINGERLLVVNKIDLIGGELGAPGGAIGVSCLTGTGIEALRGHLAERVAALAAPGAAPALTRGRHRAALARCREAIARALGAEAAELTAEDLRLAARELGRITGRVDVEAVLDSVFAELCIGK